MAVMMPIALEVIVHLALSGRYSLRPTGNGAAAGPAALRSDISG
jgi:hypothetical protein